MIKKLLVIVMMVLLVSTATFATNDEPSSWAKEFVENVSEQEILSADFFYGYKNAITRGEFAYLGVKLYEQYTGKVIDIGDATFVDTSDEWALKAKNVGIVGGYPDGTFKPENSIKRDELAVLFHNVLKAAGVTYVEYEGEPFKDDDIIASWAKESVYIAKSNGIINGVGDNIFNPTGSATKEQSLIMFNKGQTSATVVSTKEESNGNQFVEVTIPTYEIHLNWEVLDNIHREYPIVAYEGECYLPMTKDIMEIFGIDIETNDLGVISISKNKDIDFIHQAPFLNQTFYETGFKEGNKIQATIVKKPILINEKYIKSSEQEFSIFEYEGMLYLPLSQKMLKSELRLYSTFVSGSPNALNLFLKSSPYRYYIIDGPINGNPRSIIEMNYAELRKYESIDEEWGIVVSERPIYDLNLVGFIETEVNENYSQLKTPISNLDFEVSFNYGKDSIFVEFRSGQLIDLDWYMNISLAYTDEAIDLTAKIMKENAENVMNLVYDKFNAPDLRVNFKYITEWYKYPTLQMDKQTILMYAGIKDKDGIIYWKEY